MQTGHIDVLALIGNSKSSNALISQHPAEPGASGVGPRSEKPAVIFPDADIDLAVKECVKRLEFQRPALHGIESHLRSQGHP